MELTESRMMQPGDSDCCFYFASPESSYFSVGKIGEDQVRRLGEAVWC